MGKNIFSFVMQLCIILCCMTMACSAFAAQDAPVDASANSNVQVAIDRAGELKMWREYCNDSDPDLRLAYIERAIATHDAPIQRICTRMALESDNLDIRNLGLRVAIAASPQITFTVEMPKELSDALKAAGTDEGRVNAVYRTRLNEFWTMVKEGVVFVVDGAKVTSPSSVWFPLVGLDRRKDDYKGNAVITGNKLVWVGRSAPATATLNVTLMPGGELKGFFKMDREPAFPVSAKLL